VRFGEHPLEQGGLPGTQEAGEDGGRDEAHVLDPFGRCGGGVG
jgi:hypothetical protein